MGNKPYHHGNLRDALIKAGLELISTEGEENLSLRKVALKCGVSNAAPYAPTAVTRVLSFIVYNLMLHSFHWNW